VDIRRHCVRYDCDALYAPSDSTQRHCSPRCAKITASRRLRKKKRNAMFLQIQELVTQYNRREITAKELSYEIRILGDIP